MKVSASSSSSSSSSSKMVFFLCFFQESKTWVLELGFIHEDSRRKNLNFLDKCVNSDDSVSVFFNVFLSSDYVFLMGFSFC